MSILVTFFFMAGFAPPAAVKIPVWLLEEINRPLPSQLPETPAVVLLDEQKTEVDRKGALLTTCRRAIRILRPGAAEETRQLVRYSAYDTKVRSMKGWVINPDGQTRETTMKQAFSSSLAPDTLYMDARMIVLILPEVDVGTVVGFEWEEEHKPPSLEDSFVFQGSFPVLRAKYSLSLPPAWAAEFHTINWGPLEPRTNPEDPQITNLELSDVPGIIEEPYMPDGRAMAGRLLIRIRSPETDDRSFSGWQDLGTWYEELSRKRRIPNDTISFKASSLTTQISGTLEKICALAEFVQKEIRYVSIQIGIGGFRPHSAPSILANRYGDCKDKATLLSSLLQALGFDSYPVLVHTDRGFVTLDSPVSLYSFNHAILAIRLPDDIPDEDLDGIVRHPVLGRLLVFDPTMPTTPLGRLPFYLQDNTALLVANGGGELIRLPRPKPENNLLERTGRFVLSNDGALSGEIREVRRGSMADSLRYRIQASSEAERRKLLETALAGSLASFTLENYEFQNLDDAREDLLLSYRFIAPSYAKRAGDLRVVRPRVMGQWAVDLSSRDKRPRRYPIDFETTSLSREDIVIELPDGYLVESLPAPVRIDGGFAAYTSSVEAGKREIRYRREYRLDEPLLPASQFEDALKFYLSLGAEEQQSVLLKISESRSL